MAWYLLWEQQNKQHKHIPSPKIITAANDQHNYKQNYDLRKKKQPENWKLPQNGIDTVNFRNIDALGTTIFIRFLKGRVARNSHAVGAVYYLQGFAHWFRIDLKTIDSVQIEVYIILSVFRL